MQASAISPKWPRKRRREFTMHPRGQFQVGQVLTTCQLLPRHSHFDRLKARLPTRASPGLAPHRSVPSGAALEHPQMNVSAARLYMGCDVAGATIRAGPQLCCTSHAQWGTVVSVQPTGAAKCHPAARGSIARGAAEQQSAAPTTNSSTTGRGHHMHERSLPARLRQPSVVEHQRFDRRFPADGLDRRQVEDGSKALVQL